MPLMDLSSCTVIVPLPDAEVLTGGTSWSPLRLTLTSVADAMPAPPASTLASNTMMAKLNRDLRKIVSIYLPPWGFGLGF
jgi:hypothetical protein